MLRVNLLEPSFLAAVKDGRKTQVTFLWPEHFANKSNDIAIYENNRILGVAKIKRLLKIQGGVIPTGSSYDDADSWALAEGFESFWDANEWFSNKYGNNWQENTWGIIQFENECFKGVE